MIRSVFFSGMAVLLLVEPAGAQAGVTDRSSPPGRAHHALFYDEARQRVLVTGGSAVDNRRNVEEFNDLWSFDGNTWTSLASPGNGVSGARVAVDAQKRIYSFGGFPESPTGELRRLENGRWRTVGTHPSMVAAEPGFVFDAARNRFVAFGGGAGSGRVNADVWEFDGVSWMKNSAAPPPARSAHAMVYDARRKKTVVVGGQGVRVGDQDTPILGDTWEFDGASWTQIRVGGPPARIGAGAAYDSKRGLMILFGGANHERALNDLWSWDGAAWKKLAENGPEPRVMGYIAYDAKRDRIVLFGGRRASSNNSDIGDTWEWDAVAWKKIGK
jgi:N-acetylneuraminic acid mutarotase